MPEDDDDGLIECAHCGGKFDSSDMDGEHCHDCSAEIFGED